MTTDHLQQILSGDRRALARLLTQIENEHEGVEVTLSALYAHTGKGWVIGVTGAPGTGKSTLVSALAKAYRAQDKTVAIVAVDPTSPFTGGALLGDRIRMRDLHGDTGVFIRSMATRGSLGGLSRTTRDTIRAFDAAGFDIILVETVGAGQSEVDIARMAYTTLVVDAPGLGDDVQAIKAGILEIADILVINKADRPGAANTARALRAMLELGHPSSRQQLMSHHGRTMKAAAPVADHDQAVWIPKIVQTVAVEHKGIDTLIDCINSHREYLQQTAIMKQVETRQIEIELSDRVREVMMARLMANLSAEWFSEIVERVQARQTAPQDAVEEILAEAAERGAQ